MQTLITLALLGGLVFAPEDDVDGEADVPELSEPARVGSSGRAGGFAPLHAYLTRELPRSARFLDHGVLGLRGAGGSPHLYRVDLQVGLFDHLSVGVTANWLPGQAAPQVWPVIAVAAWRWRGTRGIGVNLGAHYRPVLFRPVDRELSFVPETHLGVITSEVHGGWFSVGMDLGVAHSRLASLDPNDTLTYRPRALFGGGVFARVGNRRMGLTFDALTALSPNPLLIFELALDVRFGVFEERPRGGWLER